MINKHQFAETLGIDLDLLCRLHAIKSLPEPIKVGDDHLWREEDVELYVDYLRDRSECRERGMDPDSVDGPPVPIYSTAGKPRFDPRLVVAQEQENKRREKSRTLRAGTKAIVVESSVVLPELPTENKVEAE